MMLTDTDSMILRIEADDLYADIRADEHMQSFLDMNANHSSVMQKSLRDANNGVYGKLKSEVTVDDQGNFSCIQEVICLKPKDVLIADIF